MDLNSLLNKEGRDKVAKQGPDTKLWSYHFASIDAYMEYDDYRRCKPWMTELLDGVKDPDSIDPRLLRNLSRILHKLQDQLDDKEDRTTDW